MKMRWRTFGVAGFCEERELELFLVCGDIIFPRKGRGVDSCSALVRCMLLLFVLLCFSMWFIHNAELNSMQNTLLIVLLCSYFCDIVVIFRDPYVRL